LSADHLSHLGKFELKLGEICSNILSLGVNYLHQFLLQCSFSLSAVVLKTRPKILQLNIHSLADCFLLLLLLRSSDIATIQWLLLLRKKELVFDVLKPNEECVNPLSQQLFVLIVEQGLFAPCTQLPDEETPLFILFGKCHFKQLNSLTKIDDQLPLLT
jgi:hypothetical protein